MSSTATISSRTSDLDLAQHAVNWHPATLHVARAARSRTPLLAGAALGVLAVLAIGGDVFGWRWTGFHGNTLWDWLRLFILPVVLAVLPTWLRTRESHERLWRLAIGAIMVGFAVTIIGGYALDWRWTGFHGNTVWEWLQLLIVPFVLPAALLHINARLGHDGS